MNELLRGKFFNPTNGYLKTEEVLKEVKKYIFQKPESFYDIVVGCDSSSGKEPHFPVVLVVLRKGEGGRFFLKRVSYKDRKFYNWKERILQEVTLSCELALFLREKIEKEVGLFKNYQFRYIHADIGEKGATQDMIKEIVGLIRGNGFEPKIKPEAFAASIIADRYS